MEKIQKKHLLRSLLVQESNCLACGPTNPVVRNATFLYPLKISEILTVFEGALGMNGLKEDISLNVLPEPLHNLKGSFFSLITWTWPIYASINSMDTRRRFSIYKTSMQSLQRCIEVLQTLKITSYLYVSQICSKQILIP